MSGEKFRNGCRPNTAKSFAESLAACGRGRKYAPGLCEGRGYGRRVMEDQIVEEIRRIRREHAKEFAFDLDAIFEDLKRREQQRGQKTVTLSPRPAKKMVSRK